MVVGKPAGFTLLLVCGGDQAPALQAEGLGSPHQPLWGMLGKMQSHSCLCGWSGQGYTPLCKCCPLKGVAGWAVGPAEAHGKCTPPGICREVAPARPTAPWQNLREGNPGGRHFSTCLYKLEVCVLPRTSDRGKARDASACAGWAQPWCSAGFGALRPL